MYTKVLMNIFNSLEHTFFILGINLLREKKILVPSNQDTHHSYSFQSMPLSLQKGLTDKKGHLGKSPAVGPSPIAYQTGCNWCVDN